MPPVTVLPEYGSLTASSLSLSMRGDGLQVSVADSHIERATSPQNFSGLPNTGDFFAKFCHNVQSLSSPGSLLPRASTGTVSISP